MGERICMKEARLTLPGGRTIVRPWPVHLNSLLEEPEFKVSAPDRVVAVRVNDLAKNLSEDLPVRMARVEPILWHTNEGMSFYRRTLTFVMSMAASRCLSGHSVYVQNRIGPYAYLVVVDDAAPVDAATCDKIRAEMQDIIKKDLPIEETLLSNEEAIEHFKATGRQLSVAAVETSHSNSQRVCVCDGYAALYVRPLCPSTGFLSDFDVRPAPEGPGFALVFPSLTPVPRPGTPEQQPSKKARLEYFMPGPDTSVEMPPALAEVYRDYRSWCKVIRASSAGQLNERVQEGCAKELVTTCEALQNRRIVQLALQIEERIKTGLKLVLIAGPSASGKTTFASKLSTQLRTVGCTPVVLSVDNYYLPRLENPKDEDGNYDFECLEALRIDALNQDLLRLMRGELVKTPVFDFKSGLIIHEALPLQLPENGVLIMEGIHGLNDALTPLVPANAKFKIFVAPLTQTKLDELNFAPHTIWRLFRRILRDHRTRGWCCRDTLAHWTSVTRGEEKHIFPYFSHADYVYNTALELEVCIMKPSLVPLLRTVPPGTAEYSIARDLLRILDSFNPITSEHVPPDSLLREFIGGSCFE